MSTQCRFCGEAVRPDSMFCPACGQLTSAVSGAVPPFPGGAPQKKPARDAPETAAPPAPVLPPVPLPVRRPSPGKPADAPAPAPGSVPAPSAPSATSAPARRPAPSAPAQQPAPASPSDPGSDAAAEPPAAEPRERPAAVVLPDSRRIALNRVLVFGRSPEQGAATYHGVPVRLDDRERAMSRVHLVVSPDDRAVTATDPGSANGTLLERAGARYALVAGRPTSLLVGDRLLLGDAVIVVA